MRLYPTKNPYLQIFSIDFPSTHKRCVNSKIISTEANSRIGKADFKKLLQEVSTSKGIKTDFLSGLLRDEKGQEPWRVGSRVNS